MQDFDEHLLDITIVPSSLSPISFSQRLTRCLSLRSFNDRRADAVTHDNPMLDNKEAGPSTTGITLLSKEAQKSTEVHLTNKLRPILKDKSRISAKYQFLRNCLTDDIIPKGVLPLKIHNTPESLKQKWEDMLKECGHKLLRILIDFHRDQISSLEDLAQETITQANTIILPEFVTNIPSIGEDIEDAMENLIETQ